MKLVIMQFLPASYYFACLGFSYSPCHPVLKNYKSVFFLNVTDKVVSNYGLN
jgi:hypothetical protein